jgi:hypothetical protein
MLRGSRPLSAARADDLEQQVDAGLVVHAGVEEDVAHRLLQLTVWTGAHRAITALKAD